MNSLDTTFTFSDFQGFAALRRGAADDTPEAKRAVARQFEAMFLNQILSQMRSANAIDGGLFDAEKLKPYESMHDQQLALNLSQGRGIGLADAILRQLGETPAAPITRSAPNWGPRTRADFRPESPAAFVAALRPHAERAGRALGVDPDVLIGQAALETGWGRSQIKAIDGRSSFNLFGIKATGNWTGAKAVVPTLEFVDGVPERRVEPFRAYESLGQAFDDYVALISGQPRYRQALAATDGEQYLRALQAAGYATDPDYANKILSIVERGLPGRSAQGLAAVADSSQDGTARTRVRAGLGDES